MNTEKMKSKFRGGQVQSEWEGTRSAIEDALAAEFGISVTVDDAADVILYYNTRREITIGWITFNEGVWTYNAYNASRSQ